MENILFLIIGVVAGALVAWIIRKLLVEKNMVARDAYAKLENELMQVVAAQKFAQEKIADQQKTITC
ncbi:MAG: hypothetical protein IPI65_14510 [Bacteroidetes bacterium]|nr:hypothetical protein [Bacteroidota bacterium]